MKIFFVMLALLAFPIAVKADTSTPLYYSRADISIMRKSAPQQTAAQLPWQKAANGLVFDVEVRDGMTMYNQKGWFNLSSPSEKNGVLMMFSGQGQPPIIRLTQYAPLDILMIDHEGNITQIIPNIKLSELEDDITPASPVLAFLFLKGGLCEQLLIKPGDVVEYKAFKKPPVVWTAPASQAAPAPSVPTPSTPIQPAPSEPVQLQLTPAQ